MNVIRKLHMLNFLKDRLKGETVNLILPEGIFDFILFVNVRKGTYTRKYGKRTFVRKIPEEGRYADFLKIMQMRACGGKEELYESMKLIRVAGALAVQEKYIAICSLKIGNGTCHKKFTFIRNTLYEKPNQQKENIVVFCEDITGIHTVKVVEKESEDVFEEKREKAETLPKQVVYLSHEIRTSLNSIYGNLKMLHEEVGPGNVYLSNAALSAEHLLNLVNSVLCISTLEKRDAGRIEAVTMEELIKYPKGIFEYEVKRRNIRLQFDCGKPVYQYLYLNRAALQQVIINLISNAVKYTNDGGTVICRMEECLLEEKRVRFLLEISDTGIGMEEAFLADAWKTYGRERRKKDAEGSGLGLTLTKYLVDMLHGTIRLETKSGIGTTVSVTVEADGDDILYEQSQKPRELFTQEELWVKRALVAEDEDANMEVICSCLKKLGIAADKTYNGEEAVEIFRQSEEDYYDIILMDVHMPGKSGIEAIKEIRNMERKDSGMPVIVMTADILDERVLGELSAAVSGCLVKPYREEDVRSVLLQCGKKQAVETRKRYGTERKRENNDRIGGIKKTGKRIGDSSAESTFHF